MNILFSAGTEFHVAGDGGSAKGELEECLKPNEIKGVGG
jgi:hypothetical protein